MPNERLTGVEGEGIIPASCCNYSVPNGVYGLKMSVADDNNSVKENKTSKRRKMKTL